MRRQLHTAAGDRVTVNVNRVPPELPSVREALVAAIDKTVVDIIKLPCRRTSQTPRPIGNYNRRASR